MSDGMSGPAPSDSRRLRQRMPGSNAPERWLLGLVLLTVVLLSFLGETGRLALRYEREAVLDGEFWRLVTGHLVHGNTLHLLLNIGGLGLVAWLFRRQYSWRAWLLIALFSLVAIDLGLVFLEPQWLWYVGLSGILQGALAAGGIAWWRRRRPRFKVLALALGAILLGKLAWEQWQGALPFVGDMPVVVDAHLYGALGGTLAGFMLWLQAHRQVAVKSRI